MTVFLLFAVTWSRATIPDMKENSKTEKLKDCISVNMVKTTPEFSGKSEFNFVANQNYETDISVIEKANKDYKLPTKAIQNFSKSIKALSAKTCFRNPRDALRYRKN